MADPTAPGRLYIRPLYLLLILLPMAVVTGSEALLNTFADTSVLTSVTLIEAPEIPELIGRYRFLAVFFFYAAICLAVLGIFIFDMGAHYTWRAMLFCGVAFGLLMWFVTLFAIWEPDWMGGFEAYELLSAQLFETGLATGEMSVCATGICDGQGAFYGMRRLMNMINVISGLAVIAVLLGMVMALSRPGPPDLRSEAGVLREARVLEAAQKTTRRYLYLSGVLLSVGMMYGLGWMMWPADLLADPGEAQGYADLVQAIALFRGVSYTILILSYYMPVSLILMIRIEAMRRAAEALGQEETPLVAQVEGFDIERIGSLDALKAILSLLAPIIASAVGSFSGLNALG